MPAKIDVTGKTFGRLTVLGDAPRGADGRRRVFCICSCGKDRIIEPRWLTQGATLSCGCLQREAVSKAAKLKATHGMSGTKEYNVWVKIRSRCHNPNDNAYYKYGAKGISVCDDWRSSFESFFEAMGRAPTKNHSIDRIDVLGNYEPSNCRWATDLEQANNKRSHRFVVYDGRRMPLSQACRLSGTSYASALYRLNKTGDWQPLPPPPEAS